MNQAKQQILATTLIRFKLERKIPKVKLISMRLNSHYPMGEMASRFKEKASANNFKRFFQQTHTLLLRI